MESHVSMAKRVLLVLEKMGTEEHFTFDYIKDRLDATPLTLSRLRNVLEVLRGIGLTCGLWIGEDCKWGYTYKMQEQRWSSRAAGIGENLADRAGRVYLGVRTNPGPVTTRDLRRDLGIVLPKLWCILGVLEAIGIVDSIPGFGFTTGSREPDAAQRYWQRALDNVWGFSPRPVSLVVNTSEPR
ncbi:hypothetical protein KUCAC02_033068 [Chaenocephalus aceratus]|nr:hypothetical protein KUCAC02_033068 [Chaenocephalus aceratus]